MSIPILLHEMRASPPESDLNAIRKARGFRSSETASRNSFASYFVSFIGVDEAIQNLGAEEIITLHLLHQTGEVDVVFFERLYGAPRKITSITTARSPGNTNPLSPPSNGIFHQSAQLVLGKLPLVRRAEIRSSRAHVRHGFESHRR